MRRVGGSLSVLGLGLLAGGMLFFPIMTLLIFIRLPLAVAGPFVNGCFPIYYGFMLISSVVAGLGFALRLEPKTALTLWCISLLTLWAWFWMIPQMNADLATGNKLAFDRYHRLSTWIDGLELALILLLLLREGVRSAQSQRFRS